MSKHLEKARAAVAKKNYEYAIEIFLQHLKATPGDIEARKELRAAERAQKKMGGGGGLGARIKMKALEAKCQLIRVNAKDPEKSILACEDVLKQDPDVTPALLKLGEAASYASLNDVAIYVFEDILAQDAKCNEAYRLLGRVLRATGQLEKALKCFQRLQKLDPKDKEADEMVRNIPASMTAQKVQEGVDKGGYQNLIDKDEAGKLERQSQRVRTPEQALERISELEPLVKKDPKDIKSMRLIAELYLKAEQPDQALQWCERALKVDPKDYLASELRGDMMLKKHEQHVQACEEAYNRGRDEQSKARVVKARQGKLLFEIEEYARRVEAHPTELGLRFQLGKSYFDAGKIDEAIQELQKAKQDPLKKAEAGYYLGHCFVKKKIFNLAVKELKAAREDLFEMDGLKKDITYLLGRIYEQAKKPDLATAEYEQIAQSDYSYKDVTKRLESLSKI